MWLALQVTPSPEGVVGLAGHFEPQGFGCPKGVVVLNIGPESAVAMTVWLTLKVAPRVWSPLNVSPVWLPLNVAPLVWLPLKVVLKGVVVLEGRPESVLNSRVWLLLNVASRVWLALLVTCWPSR